MHELLEHVIALDRALMQEAGDLRWAPATALFIIASAWWVKGPLFVLVGVLRDVRDRVVPATGLAIAAAFVTGDVASGAIKQAVDRPRPPLDDPGRLDAAIALPSSPSFPSGHATTTFAAAAAVAVLMPRLRWPALALAVLVATSRVYLGVHFVLDVIVGAALGALIGLGIALGRQEARRRAPPGRARDRLADDGQRAGLDRQLDLGLVADPVAVDLQRHGPPVGRAQPDRLGAREAADLAVVEQVQALGEQPQHDPGTCSGVARCRTMPARSPLSSVAPSATCSGVVSKKVNGSPFCTIASMPGPRLPVGLERHPRRIDEVVREERADPRPGEVPLAHAVLALGRRSTALTTEASRPVAGREGEVAVVGPGQVDAPRLPVVGDPQQVLGGVDDLAGDPEHLAEDVRARRRGGG
jgi:undecaprenyl-diphosphatase